MRLRLVSGISSGFPGLSQSKGQVGHVLLTRSPLIPLPKESSPFDLHVLSTPPAFVLSQDQTLQKKLVPTPSEDDAGNSITDRETTDYKNQIVHQSKESIPTPKGVRLGFNKLALNIVHAVEFSRNGRFLCTHPLGLSSGRFPSVLRFRLYQIFPIRFPRCFPGSRFRVSLSGGSDFTRSFRP